MSKPTQAKLLRVIQDGVVRRVGSEATDAVVNVRFIAATNGDPEEAVKSGALREDLYYRLRVVPIYVPRLKNRPEDIPLLAGHFLHYYWRAHRDAKSAVPTLSESAIRALRAEDLPFAQGGEVQSTAADEAGAVGAVPSAQTMTMPLEETYHVARER